MKLKYTVWTKYRAY